jgi:hypothetical protein
MRTDVLAEEVGAEAAGPWQMQRKEEKGRRQSEFAFFFFLFF